MKTEEMKSKILQLAIQGKLVKQDENDTPASVLLERIKQEKERLIKEKKIKRDKPLPEITEEEKAFQLPMGWEWCRLGDIGIFKKGPFGSTITKSIFVEKSEDTIKVYEQKNAIQKNAQLGDYYVSREYFEEKLKGFEVFPGDIIVSCAGTIGETYIMPQGIERGIINQALMKMRIFDGININYFLIYFESILKDSANNSSKGSAIKNIPAFSIFKKMIFALPPLDEQKRIVAKINELFEIVDKIKSNKESMLKSISDTRNKVLQLAIQGKLVKQDENDIPASVLLERIKEEKEKLIKEKKIKKEKVLPEIAEEEKIFEIPEGWVWCRLNDVCKLITDGTHTTPNYTDKGVPFLSVKDITSGIIDFSNTRFISREEHEVLIKRCNPEYKDVLLTKIGTTGIAKVVDTKKEFSIFVSIALLKLYRKYVDERYIELLINSPFVKKQSEENTQGVGNKNLVIRCIKNFSITLPPLEEQKRIVSKVDEIMKHLDKLEKQIQ